MNSNKISDQESSSWFKAYIQKEGRSLGFDPHSYFKELGGYPSRNFAKERAYYIAYHINKSPNYKNLLEDDNESSCG